MCVTAFTFKQLQERREQLENELRDAEFEMENLVACAGVTERERELAAESIRKARNRLAQFDEMGWVEV